MPKSTFFSNGSARYAVIRPNSGSSGACGTTRASKGVAMLGERWFATWPSLECGDDLDMTFCVVALFLSGVIQHGCAILQEETRSFDIAFLLRITPTERKSGKNSILRWRFSMDTRRDTPAFYSSVIVLTPVDELQPRYVGMPSMQARSLIFSQRSSKLFTSPGI